MAKKSLRWLLLLSLLLLAGCWDMLEIEERGFIIGSSIDLGQKISDNRYKITIIDQLAIPTAFGVQGGSSNQEAFINLTASGESIFEIDQEMNKQTSKIPFFEHLKVIVVSEELVSIPHLFENILDIHIRDAEFRRGIKVLIAKGKAMEVIDIKPKDEKLPSMYINKLLEQTDVQSDVNKGHSIGDIQELNLNMRSYTLPIIHAAEDRVQYEGAAVFHGYQKRMIGTLTTDETFGLNLITDDSKTGSFDFMFKNEMISTEIQKLHHSIKVNSNDINNIKVNVSIELTGVIKEVFGHIYPTNQGDMNEVEKAAEKEIKKLTYDVIKKGQEEFNADIFGIDKQLYTRHYDTWQKVKENWDHGENYFSRVTFNIEPNVSINNTGTSEKTFSEDE